jgi:hypothetical protein
MAIMRARFAQPRNLGYSLIIGVLVIVIGLGVSVLREQSSTIFGI